MLWTNLSEIHLKTYKRGHIMETLAIIPARGGSKGIRRKNIRLLNGKPLIYYQIQNA